jgi:prepilin-type N-terminal cleavage/methylation domain-containing protein
MARKASRGASPGFTLVEIVISLVILGVVFTVGTLFFATMLRGYTNARIATEIGQVAEIALDRMVFELKDATGTGAGNTVTVVDNTSVQYESTNSTLTGTRMISFDGSDLNLSVDGASHLLLENVTAFSLDVTENDIDGNAANGNEISTFNISFTVLNYGGTFSAQVAPRSFVRK